MPPETTRYTNSLWRQMDEPSAETPGKKARYNNKSKRNHSTLHYAKIISLLAVVVTFKRSILWWLAAHLLLLAYALYKVCETRSAPIHPYLPQKRKFSFLDGEPWRSNIAKLSLDPVLLRSPAIKESPAISQSVAQLSELILREFVDSWFKHISADTLFQDSIKAELNHVFASLAARLAAVDIPTVLVHKIIPVLTEHYGQYTSSPHGHDTAYSAESKLNVARKFRGKIHEGVSITVPGFGKTKEKEFLRKKVQAILPYLLSPQERSNSIVTTLLTEILACTVLTNVFAVLSEGDFFNQMIVKFVGANLQHRSQVKRLRAALQKHTSQTPESTLKIADISMLPRLISPISPECVAAWTVQIARCGTEDERRRLSAILNEQKRTLDPSSDSHQKDLATISKLSSMIANSQKLPKVQTLEAVLAEPKRAAVFREFLRRSKDEAEVDLWQDIELMRAPLEGTDASEVPLLLEFSNKDDIIKIHQKYFSMECFKITPQIRTPVQEYVQSDVSKHAALYHNARQALFELQSDVFQHMKNVHFRQFQNSSWFGDLESFSPRKQSNRRAASSAFPRTKSHGYEGATHESSAPAVSPVVVKAVESAFEKIMEASSIEQENKVSTLNPFYDSEPTDNLLHKSSQASLFGDTTAALDATAFGSQRASSNRLSSLFENNSDSESDTNSILSDSLDSDVSGSGSHNMSNSELLLAAPGDLSLAEKIDVLDQDIENLSEQNEILLSLLKKAELTNNVAELKILRRSNASLEKEINSKELQKQQYIVQENDNSLYGKSKVKIQSCVFGKDENLTYVMYVIEVQKYSSEDPNEIVAGWIVARRFSQFHKLNEYLKRKYPDVNEIKFPKKNVPYLKFQQTQQIETRKPLLEKYLQDLLTLPDVCSDPAFRSFLSSENFHVGKSPLNSKAKMDSIFNRFYQDLGKEPQVKKVSTPQEKRNEQMLLNIREMERELKQYDETQKNPAEKVPFIKPISDLLLTIFDLSKSNWLRGRALLVILQQVLGSTIERTFVTQIEQNVKQEWRVVDILTLLQEMLFPNRKFRESPELRTKSEQLATRKEANTILHIFMSETCSKIFGVKNTDQACTNLLEMFQNDYLNKHLIFQIFDELVLALFPETGESSEKV